MSAVLDHSSEQASKPKLGVSACLMGVEVRFNGGHKESHLLTRALNEYFDFVPACPEVAIGMGILAKPFVWWETQITLGRSARFITPWMLPSNWLITASTWLLR